MSDRRVFLKGAAATVAIATMGKVNLAMAAPEGWTNIIFTMDNPGIWKGREATHLPQITVVGRQVSLETVHVMTDEHFIVRHTVVLPDGTFVGGTVFYPGDDPVSSYELPEGYRGKIYASSYCNLHDLWIAEAVV